MGCVFSIYHVENFQNLETNTDQRHNWLVYIPKILLQCRIHIYTVYCKHYVYFQKSALRSFGGGRRLWVFNTTLGPLCQSSCGYLTSDNNVKTTDGSARSYKNGSQGDS